jgi:hypothetical protein
MSTPSNADYAARSAVAYERRLRVLLERHGLPATAPEAAGERAAMLAAAGPAWAQDVGPFFDTDGARVALGGVTKQAVSQRVASRRLLGLRLASDDTARPQLVYPAWQFEREVLRHLPRVLAAAGFEPTRPVTGWTIAAWLTTSTSDGGGASPLELLRAGHAAAVERLAAEIAASLGVDERAAAERTAS